ncbi:MAG TPA: ABC transporter permease [Bacteroidales bacterium]|nr:ABC transporter permease [Bacteroidales bacterium]
MRTILYILQKEFIQVSRNRTMLPIIFVVPILQLLVLSYTATFEIKNVDLYIVDQDLSPASREITAKFKGSPFYTIVGSSVSFADAEDALINNSADQILQIPAGFAKGLVKEKESVLQLTTNAINGSAASLMNAYALSIIRDYNTGIIVNGFGLKAPPDPIRISRAFWYNPELNYFTYMVPGILVLLVTVISAFLTSMNIVREKEIGTIEQINVTPIRKYQFILGKLIPFWVIALFELAFGLVIAKLIFNVPILGNLGLVFLMAGVYLLVTLGLGLLISTLSNTQQQAMFLTFFFMIIFILMSGLFTPVDSMPEWAQMVNRINPISYFIEVMRMVLLKGSVFSDLTRHFVSLLVLAILLNTLAVWRYRKVV